MAARALPLGALCACVLLAGCGVWVPTGGPPPAQDILARPARADLRDAHFSVSGFVGGAVVADGDIVFRPRLAMRLRETTSSGPTPETAEILAVDGQVYQRVGDTKWSQVSTSIAPVRLRRAGTTGRPWTL